MMRVSNVWTQKDPSYGQSGIAPVDAFPLEFKVEFPRPRDTPSYSWNEVDPEDEEEKDNEPLLHLWVPSTWAPDHAFDLTEAVHDEPYAIESHNSNIQGVANQIEIIYGHVNRLDSFQYDEYPTEDYFIESIGSLVTNSVIRVNNVSSMFAIFNTSDEVDLSNSVIASDMHCHFTNADNLFLKGGNLINVSPYAPETVELESTLIKSEYECFIDTPEEVILNNTVIRTEGLGADITFMNHSVIELDNTTFLQDTLLPNSFLNSSVKLRAPPDYSGEMHWLINYDSDDYHSIPKSGDYIIFGDLEPDQFVGFEDNFMDTLGEPKHYSKFSFTYRGTNMVGSADEWTYRRAKFYAVNISDSIVVNIDMEGNGYVDPFGKVLVNQGSDLMINMEPDKCWKIEDILVDGIPVNF